MANLRGGGIAGGGGMGGSRGGGTRGGGTSPKRVAKGGTTKSRPQGKNVGPGRPLTSPLPPKTRTTLKQKAAAAGIPGVVLIGGKIDGMDAAARKKATERKRGIEMEKQAKFKRKPYSKK